eukprot:TRINITY_DN30084_c0_g1_i1.p1 TRINITY_DN30084_c0_g1~~TRINITY_DN30084_c0_g1_i1.p1  ORF type:complete len:1044 (-),score=224.44 TRINITY_DN30084_c0_g1_i1:40-3171(-)
MTTTTNVEVFKDPSDDVKTEEKPASLVARWNALRESALEKVLDIFLYYPVSFCGGCSFLMLLLSVISILTGCMTFTDPDGAFSITEAYATKWMMAYDEASARADKLSAEQTDLLSKGGPSYTFLYKSPDGGDLFTPKRLQDICKWEAVVRTSDIFRSHCRRVRGDPMGCDRMVLSPLKLFYGSDLSAYDWSCSFLDSAQVELVKTNMMASLKRDGVKSPFAIFVDKSAVANGYTSFSRGSMSFGTPSNISEQAYNKAKQEGLTAKQAEEVASKAYKEETLESLLELEKKLWKQPDKEMAYGWQVSAYEVDWDRFTTVGSIKVRFLAPYRNDFDLVGGDFLFAGFSILFVLCYMYLHLRSMLIASMSVLAIVCSMPLAALFYAGVFQVGYFHFIQILTIFLVLGIGADNIFVLCDSWKNTAELIKPADRDTKVYSYSELRQRLRITYLRTAGALFNTSFTTGMAFMSSSVSKVMPMRTNGWFAAQAIFANYIIAITLSPSLLMIHHYYLSGKRSVCPRWSFQTPAEEVKDDCERVLDLDQLVAESEAAANKRLSLFEKVLNQYYLPFMKKKVGGLKLGAVLVIFTLLGVATQGVYFSSQLTPPQEEEAWFPDNHMYVAVRGFFAETFSGLTVDSFASMSMVWGVKDLDRSGDKADVYRPLNPYGELVFDDRFDLSKKEAQDEILSACKAIRELPCTYEACDKGSGKLAMELNGSVACFLENFGDWLAQKRVDRYNAVAANGSATSGELAAARAERDRGTELETGPKFFEELKVFRKTNPPSKEMRENGGANWEKQIGFIDGELKYVEIKFRSVLPSAEALATGRDVRTLIWNWAEQRRNSAPATALGPRIVCRRFAPYDLQEELLAALFSGCSIAGPVAFIVLLLSTKNIIVSFYAVISVSSVVLCVLGFCKGVMDYDLGVAESIAGVIVIGYSVDYVVHLAHMYEEAHSFGHRSREDRAEFAIRNMGTTVFAGAITTAGAGVIMFLCFSVFFHKMALLICVTIAYSFLFSLGFFMSLLFLAGPEGRLGDIRVPFQMLFGRTKE